MMEKLSQVLGDLKGIAQDMKEVEQELQGGSLNEQVLKKQHRILTRMLESAKIAAKARCQQKAQKHGRSKNRGPLRKTRPLLIRSCWNSYNSSNQISNQGRQNAFRLSTENGLSNISKLYLNTRRARKAGASKSRVLGLQLSSCNAVQTSSGTGCRRGRQSSVQPQRRFWSR